MNKHDKSQSKKVVSSQQPMQAQSDLNKDIHKGTDMITSLIHEYLLKKEYTKTLDSYQEELAMKIKNKTYFIPSYQEINENMLMKSFMQGHKSDFFKQWNRIIPSHIKLKETAYSKLEFFIEIYFAIFPILQEKKGINQQQQKELKANMEEFKKYLETKEIELSKTTEFLAYYALPYVPNPREHPSYQNLFTKTWIEELKDKIKQCIKNYLPSLRYPVLYDLVSGNEDDQTKMELMRKYMESLGKSDNDYLLGNIDDNMKPQSEIGGGEYMKNVQGVEKDNKKLQDEIKRLKAKEEKNKIAFVDSQKTWTNLSMNIISYSFDLLNIINKLSPNNQNNNEATNAQIDKIQKRLHKYQTFLKKNAEELERNKNANNSNLLIKNDDIDIYQNSKLDDLTTNPNNTTIPPHNEPSIHKANYIDYEISFLIDMKKFTQALSHKIQIDDSKLWFIFRELRLRIFRRPDIALKHLTLYSIFYYDVLGTLSKTSTLLQQLLLNETLQLEVMKLVNSLANLNKGRNYLLAKETLIDDIVQIMIREKSDTDLRQNCLGSLQKFTLRANPQNRLIELNVIHYIVDVFTYETNALSDYTVEYGLALIMNLSLKQAGREKFETVADRILQILLNFMNKGDGQVLTCINGTLYSLLKRQKFKKEAKKFNLEAILQSFETDNPQVKKQILYILEELNNPPEEKVYDENFEDDSAARDEDELAYDEEMDGDSINEELFEEHYHCLGEFIIRNASANDAEIQKLNKFMANNPNMCGNIQKSTLNSISSSVRPEDGDRPLRRPTTPMTTNLSMTGNNQMFYHGEKRTMRNTNTLSGNGNNNGGDTGMLPKIGTDTAGAFQTKDKLKRTIPSGLNSNV